MSLLNTAITGLKAQQEALRTTGHNISNANTAGYSRQEVVLQTNTPQFRGFGYIGQGVDITSVRRITDQFMIGQLRSDTSQFQRLDAYKANIEQIDRIFAGESTSLQPTLNRFFASLQGGADNPAYLPSRDVVLGEAQSLVDRFKTIHGYLTAQNDSLNSQITSSVAQINALADGIAQLNEQIVTAQGSPTRTPPNDLLDKRDELVRQLSEFVDVSVTEDNRQLNISIGNGQALVLAGQANRLQATGGVEDSERFGVRFISGIENVFITDDIKGGQLAGLINFRRESLDTAMNNLGRISVALISQINATQTQGIDLNGNFGQNFFQDLNDPELAISGRAQGSALNVPPKNQIMSVFFEDPAALTTSDYELSFDGPENFNYQITRKNDGSVIKDGALIGDLPQEIHFDGLKIRLESGNFKTGDSFTINPLRDVPRQLELLIREPAEIAFAYPMRAGTAAGNLGSGTINQGQMLSRVSDFFANNSLTPPLLIQFDSPTHFSVYDNSDPGNPVPLKPPMQYIEFVPGVSNTLFTSDPGETLVSSWRPRLPENPSLSLGGPTAVPPYNGINSERFIFSRTNSEGEVITDPMVITKRGSSAADIASRLSRIDGVTARAYTQVQLANFTNSGTPYEPDNPFEVWVNGYEITLDDLGPSQTVFAEGYPDELPDELGPNFLADRINAHLELQQAGISAKSDGTTLTITDANGEDILIEMRGDKPSPVIVGSPPLGAGPITGAIHPGDTFEISSGERWSVEPIAGNTRGLLNNRTGFDFSNGGPYQYEMYLPDGRTGRITLTSNHSTAEDVKADIENQIGALLDSPGRVEAFISEKGDISYQVFMKVSGTGNADVQSINLGGQVDVVMADGIHMETKPSAGAIFTGTPESKSTFTGFQFNLSGRPDTGDEFTISWNKGGVSDNRNALNLVSLETKDTLNRNDGGMTFVEAYSQAVERIGTKTRQIQIQTKAAEGSLRSIEEELNSVRGVNLDEEAARLIEFQLAYNANAQMIRIAQETFDSLLAAF